MPQNENNTSCFEMDCRRSRFSSTCLYPKQTFAFTSDFGWIGEVFFRFLSSPKIVDFGYRLSNALLILWSVF